MHQANQKVDGINSGTSDALLVDTPWDMSDAEDIYIRTREGEWELNTEKYRYEYVHDRWISGILTDGHGSVILVLPKESPPLSEEQLEKMRCYAREQYEEGNLYLMQEWRKLNCRDIITKEQGSAVMAAHEAHLERVKHIGFTNEDYMEMRLEQLAGGNTSSTYLCDVDSIRMPLDEVGKLIKLPKEERSNNMEEKSIGSRDVTNLIPVVFPENVYERPYIVHAAAVYVASIWHERRRRTECKYVLDDVQVRICSKGDILEQPKDDIWENSIMLGYGPELDKVFGKSPTNKEKSAKTKELCYKIGTMGISIGADGYVINAWKDVMRDITTSEIFAAFFGVMVAFHDGDEKGEMYMTKDISDLYIRSIRRLHSIGEMRVELSKFIKTEALQILSIWGSYSTAGVDIFRKSKKEGYSITCYNNQLAVVELNSFMSEQYVLNNIVADDDEISYVLIAINHILGSLSIFALYAKTLDGYRIVDLSDILERDHVDACEWESSQVYMVLTSSMDAIIPKIVDVYRDIDAHIAKTGGDGDEC